MQAHSVHAGELCEQVVRANLDGGLCTQENSANRKIVGVVQAGEFARDLCAHVWYRFHLNGVELIRNMPSRVMLITRYQLSSKMALGPSFGTGARGTKERCFESVTPHPRPKLSLS